MVDKTSKNENLTISFDKKRKIEIFKFKDYSMELYKTLE